MPKSTLGLVPLPEKTIEHDLALLQRFQEFSAELLRIALIGISVIGFALSRILIPENGHPVLTLSTQTKCLLIIALVALGTSAAAALAHRYFAVDGVAWHLQAMRRRERGLAEDQNKARDESHTGAWRFKWAERSIRLSATSLALGAAFLVATIIAELVTR